MLTLHSLDSPLYRKQKIQQTIEDEKIKRRLARRPRIPAKLSSQEESIVRRNVVYLNANFNRSTPHYVTTSLAPQSAPLKLMLRLSVA